MTSICDTLPYDVLLAVFGCLEHELGTLFQCVLVNRTFNETALPSLYKHIEMTCDFSSVRNGYSFSYPALRTLDRRPYLKPFVRTLELHVLGWSTETLVAPSMDVLASLTNLTSFTIQVHILCPAANSSDVMRQLSNFPSVRRVTLTKPMPVLLSVNSEGLVDSKVMEAMQSWDSLAILASTFKSDLRRLCLTGTSMKGPFYVRPHTLPQLDNLREPKFPGFVVMKNLIVRHQGVGSLGAIIADDERECRLAFFKATRILLDLIPTKPELALFNIPYVQLSNADLQWTFSNSNIEVLSMYFSTAETLMIDPTKSSLLALYLRSKIQHTSPTKTMVHVESPGALKRVNSGRKFRALPLVQMLWTINPLSLRRGVDPLEE
ncbi:hypothetical protein F5146DRAFT_1017609 [Armillaria mellea]|nr:hypothetical protein F5146DRAFT_1017609 [Armillaria mellea]